jgi:predicted ArsR family transcriptional regulator
MLTNRISKALESLGSLGDPMRRRLYEAVAEQGSPVSRDQVAKTAGVARPLVAYHLDRLVKDGLLSARFERQTGRTGPGAGRPAKLYFRPEAALNVSLPARDPYLVARVLMRAHSRLPGRESARALEQAAREAGKELTTEQLADAGPVDAAALKLLLTERGYEPQTKDGRVIWLRNCVFHELAEEQRELVCGINLSLIEGTLEALPEAGLRAELRPAPGRCCVVLVPEDVQTSAP